MENKLDKYGLVKIKNPNGRFLKNIILGLCMLVLSFGGFGLFTNLNKKTVSADERYETNTYNKTGSLSVDLAGGTGGTSTIYVASKFTAYTTYDYLGSELVISDAQYVDTVDTSVTGFYLNSSRTTKISTSSNKITVPTRSGWTFMGYYTTCDSYFGEFYSDYDYGSDNANEPWIQVITASGYLSSDFTNKEMAVFLYNTLQRGGSLKAFWKYNGSLSDMIDFNMTTNDKTISDNFNSSLGITLSYPSTTQANAYRDYLSDVLNKTSTFCPSESKITITYTSPKQLTIDIFSVACGSKTINASFSNVDNIDTASGVRSWTLITSEKSYTFGSATNKINTSYYEMAIRSGVTTGLIMRIVPLFYSQQMKITVLKMPTGKSFSFWQIGAGSAYKYYKSSSSGTLSTTRLTSLTSTEVALFQKTGYVFQGLYTQANGGGTKVFNASGTINTKYKFTSADEIFGDDGYLYAYYTQGAIEITIAADKSTSANGTIFYQKTVNSKINYYWDSNATNKITSFSSVLSKLQPGEGYEDYHFAGIYTSEKGLGTKIVNIDGSLASSTLPDLSSNTTVYALYLIDDFYQTDKNDTTFSFYGITFEFVLTNNTSFHIPNVFVDLNAENPDNYTSESYMNQNVFSSLTSWETRPLRYSNLYAFDVTLPDGLQVDKIEWTGNMLGYSDSNISDSGTITSSNVSSGSYTISQKCFKSLKFYCSSSKSFNITYTVNNTSWGKYVYNTNENSYTTTTVTAKYGDIYYVRNSGVTISNSSMGAFPVAVANTGYNFYGYTLSNGLSFDAGCADTTFYITGDLTITAFFDTLVKKVALYRDFITDGADYVYYKNYNYYIDAACTMSITPSSSYSLDVPTTGPGGATTIFVGYSESYSGTIRINKYGKQIAMGVDVSTLYAVWTQIAVLDNDGGTGGLEQLYWSSMFLYLDEDYTQYIGSYQMDLPTKEGYKFGGYYSSKNGGGTCYIDATGKQVAEAPCSTYYAYWISTTKTKVTVPSVLSNYYYEEREQTVSLYNFNSSLMTVSNNKQTDAGTYYVKVTLIDPDTYAWADGTTGADIYLEWVINPMELTSPTKTGIYRYNGKYQQLQLNNYDDTIMYISDEGDSNIQKEVGKYTIVIRFLTDNYTFDNGNGASVGITWSILKGTQTGTATANDLIYDGTAQELVAVADIKGTIYFSLTTALTVRNYKTGSTEIPTGINAGTYTVYYFINGGDNYSNKSNASVSVTISKKTLTPIWSTSDETPKFTYNKAHQSPRLSVNGAASGETISFTTTYKNSSGTTLTRTVDVGTYTVTYTISSVTGGQATASNYCFDGDVTSVSKTYSITKASLTIPSQSNTLRVNGSAQSPTWNNYDSSLMTIGGTTSATNAGTYTATFTLKDTTNYQWSDGTTTAKSVSWTITSANSQDIIFYTYTSDSKAATATTVTIYEDADGKYTITGITMPTISGLTKVGWSTSNYESYLTNSSYYLGEGETVSDSTAKNYGTKYYAVYRSSTQYTINFNGNTATSGSMSSITKYAYYTVSHYSFYYGWYFKGITLGYTSFRKVEGSITYTFAGWYKEAACTNYLAKNNDTIIPTSSTLTLYAKWVNLVCDTNTYTITLNQAFSQKLAKPYYGTGSLGTMSTIGSYISAVRFNGSSLSATSGKYNGISYSSNSSTLTYTLSGTPTAAGTYTFNISYYESRTNMNGASGTAFSVNKTVTLKVVETQQLATPTNVQLHPDGTLTWDAVANAGQYQVLITSETNTDYGDSNPYIYDYNFSYDTQIGGADVAAAIADWDEPGNHFIQVVALPADGDSAYSASDLSAKYAFTMLYHEFAYGSGIKTNSLSYTLPCELGYLILTADEKTNVEVSVSLMDGYDFLGYLDNNSGDYLLTSLSGTICINDATIDEYWSVAIEAEAKGKAVTVNVKNFSGTNVEGTVMSSSTGSYTGTYYVGDTITLVNTPKTSSNPYGWYTFYGWGKGDGWLTNSSQIVNNQYTFTADDAGQTVTFNACYVISGWVVAVTNGTESDATGGTVKVHSGATAGEASSNGWAYLGPDNTYNIHAIAKSGYTFVGWYSSSSCTGTPVSTSADYTFSAGSNGNWKYWAKFINLYTITYNLAGGSVTGNPTSYTAESDAITLKNPIRNGYAFAGWTGTGLSSATKTVTIAKGSTGNRTYTATWTANTYSITYNTDGGNSITAGSYTVSTSSQTKTLTTPTKTGYTFSGYTITTNTSGATSSISSNTTLTIPANAYGNITVKAGWTIEKYTINFNSNGGSSCTAITANYGASITLPTPTKANNTFAGWYRESALTNKVTWTTMPDLGANGASTTLYAKWNAKASNGVVVTAKTGLTYTGSAQALVTVTNPNSLTIYYSLTSLADAQSTKSTTIPTGTNAGSYKVYYYVVESGSYQSSNGSVDVSIAKATGSIKLSATTGSVVYGTASKTFTASSTTNPTLTVTDDNSTAEVAISSGTVTISKLNTLSAGTKVVVTVTGAATTNYKEAKATYTLTIVQASNTPTVNMSGYTYGGTKSTPSLSNNKSTGAITYYYNTTNSNSNGTAWSTVTSSTSLNAGTYYMYAVIAADTNYTAYTTATKSFTIAKATGSITLSATTGSVAYGTASKTFTASSTTNPTLTVTDDNSTAEVAISSGTVTISKLNTLSAGTKVVVTVTGAATTNYNAAKATYTLTIVQASNTPTVNMSGYTYGGTKSTPSLSNNKSTGTVTYYYNTTNSNSNGTAWSTVTSSTSLNAGTYYMYAVIAADTNYTAYTTATKSFTIAKASLTVPTQNGTLTYNGNSQSPKWNNYDSNKMTIGGVTSGTNANTYTATFTPKANYQWSDGTTAKKTITWTMSPKSVAVVWNPTGTASYTYNGNNQRPSASVASGVTGETINLTVTYKNGSTTVTETKNAGSYTASVVIGSVTGGQAKTENYTLTNTTKSFTIGKADGSFTFADKSEVYNGSAKTITATDIVGGTVTYSTSKDGTYSATAPTYTNVGEYTIWAKLTGDANHNDVAPKSAVLKITNATLSGSVTISGTVTYGETLTAKVTNTNSATLTYKWYSNTTNSTSGGTQISGATSSTYTIGTGLVGKYIYAVVTMTKTNYTTKTVSAVTSSTVSARAVTFTADSDSKVYDGTALTKQSAKLTSGSLVSGDTATFSITGTITNVGSVTNTLNSVTIKNASGTDVSANYSITKVNGTLTITKLGVAKPTAKTGLVYTGVSQIGVTYSTGVGYTVKSGNVSGTNAGNYSAVFTLDGNHKWSDDTTADVTVSWSIAKAKATITAKAQTITYGTSITTGVAQVSVTGLVNSEKLTSITLKASTTSVTTNGTITPSGAVIKSSDGTTTTTTNYDITYATGKLVINAKETKFAITLVETTYVYDGKAKTPTVTVKDGSTTLAKDTDYTVSGDTTKTNAGTYTITVTGKGNYAGSTGSQTWTITKAQVTISAVGNYATNASTKSYVDKIYDGNANVTKTITLGTHYSVTSTGATASVTISSVYASATAGDRVITITATLADTNNFEFTSGGNKCNINGRITKATLTITGKGNYLTSASTKSYVSKTYDGNTTATVTRDTHYTVTSNGASATLNTHFTISAVYANANVGTPNVTVTLAIKDTDNYQLGTSTCTLNGKITSKSVTLTWTNTTFVYDGHNHKPTATFKGVDGTTITANVSGEQKNVGSNYTATASYSNYTFTNATQTFSITKKSVTIKSVTPSATVTKVYDTTTSVKQTFTATLEGVVSGDTVTYEFSSATYDNANVGTGKTVTVNFTASGASVGNYDCQLQTTTTGTITAKTDATVAFNLSSTSLVYNGASQTVTVSGVTADGVSIASGSYTVSGNTGTNVQEYTVTVTISSGNYAGSKGTAKWNITKSIVTINAKGNFATSATSPEYVTKTYDGNTNATVTLDTHYTVTATGKVPTVSVTAKYASSAVGTREVTITATLSDTTNYAFATNGNTCVVNGKITNKAIGGTVTIPTDVTYGSTYTGTYTKGESGETFSYQWQWSSDKTTWTNNASNATTADFMITSSRVGTNVVAGKYLRLAIIGTGNYSGTIYSNSTDAVKKMSSTISLTPSSTITKVYDGSTKVNQTITAYLDALNTVSGDKGNAVLTVTASSYADANVGTGKKVNVTVSGSGTKIDNYSFSTSVTTTGAITPATITVTATKYQAQYDGDSHSVTVTATTVANQTATIYYKAGTELTSSNYSTVGSTTNPNYKDVTAQTTIYYYIVASNHNAISGSTTIQITQKQLAISAYSATYNGTTTYARNGYSTGVKSETLNLTYTPTSKNVGTYTYGATSNGFTLVLANGTGKASNYTISSAGNFTISNSTQTLTLSSTSTTAMAYGDMVSATITKTEGATLSISYSTGGDSYVFAKIDGSTLYVVATKAQTTASQITITITAKLANYADKTVTFTVASTGTRSIASATMTLGTTSYTYSGKANTPAITVKDSIYTASSYKAKTTVTVATTDGYTASYSNNTNAGTATATVTGKTNYSGTKSTNFTINQAELTVTVASKSVVYGDALPSYTYTITGFVNSETDSVVTTKPTLACSYARYQDIGSGKFDITASGAVASNYKFTYVKGTLTVSQRQVTVTWPSTVTFTYDGNEHSVVATIGNLVNSDAVSFTYTGTTKATNQGSYTSTISGLSGTKSANYKLPASRLSQDWSIGKATVTLTVDASKTVTYGSTATVSYKASVAGTFTITSNSTSVVTVKDGYTTSAAANTPYTFTINGIKAGTGTITVKFVPTSSNYSAPADKTVNVTVERAKTAVLPSQSGTLTYNGASQSPSWSNYDSTKVTIGGVTSGTNAGDYTATFTPTSNYAWSDGTTTAKNVTWTIGKKAVGYTANSSSKTYDGKALTNATATLTSGALVDGHTASFGITGTITNVGSVTNTLNSVTIKSGTTDVTSNYEISKANGKLTVTARTLTVTPNANQSKIYGQTDPTLTYTYSGEVSGETPKFTGSLARATGENVGTYEITIGSLKLADNTPFLASNYTLVLSSTKVNFTINANTSASVVVTLSATSLVYNGSEQSVKVTKVTVAGTETTAYTTTGSLKGTNVGSYTVTVEITSGNYKGSKGTATWKITKAQVAVPTANTTTFTYNGSAQTYLPSNWSSISSVANITNNTRTDAGSQTVTVSLKDSANYEWNDGTTTNKTFTFTIGKAKLTVKADNLNVNYGADAPTYTYTITGYKGTDTVSVITGTPTLTSTYTKNSAVGTYPITVNVSKMSATNYDFIGENGTLTVGKVAGSFTFADVTVDYDGKAHSIVATNVVGGTIQYSLDNSTWTDDAPTKTNAGTYTIYARLVVDGNHTAIDNKSAKLTINKIAPTISVNNKTLSIVYGETGTSTVTTNSDGALTVSSNHTDIASATISNKVVTVKANKVGSATITVSLAEGTNWKASSVTISVTVTARAITITAGTNSWVYDNTAHTMATTLTSGTLASGDTATYSASGSITEVGSVTNTPSVVIKNASGTDVTSNYKVTKVDGTLTVTPRALTITGVTAVNRVNNGTTTVTLQGGTLQNVATGDASYVTFTLGNGTVATSTSGKAKAVTTSITISGTKSKNYTFTQPSGITVDIYRPAITFNANTGSLSGTATIYPEYGTKTFYTDSMGSTTATIPTSTKEGYTFAGYYTATTNGTQMVNASNALVNNFTGTANATWYARWNANDQTITYYSTSTTTAYKTVTVKYDASYSMPDTPTKTGFNFVGWSTTADNTAEWTTGNQTCQGNKSWYAVWSKTWKFYDTSSSSPSATVNYKVDASASQSYSKENPTLSGYTFAGYSTSNNYTVTTAKGTSSTSVTSSSASPTFYAVWTRTITQTVNYNANGHGRAVSASTASGTQSLSYNLASKSTVTVTVNIKSTSATGYTFLGWKQDDAGDLIPAGNKQFSITENSTITLYAQWKSSGEITINIKFDSGCTSGTKIAVNVYDLTNKKVYTYAVTVQAGGTATITIKGLVPSQYMITVTAPSKHTGYVGTDEIPTLVRDTQTLSDTLTWNVLVKKTMTGGFVTSN